MPMLKADFVRETIWNGKVFEFPIKAKEWEDVDSALLNDNIINVGQVVIRRRVWQLIDEEIRTIDTTYETS